MVTSYWGVGDIEVAERGPCDNIGGKWTFCMRYDVVMLYSENSIIGSCKM